MNVFGVMAAKPLGGRDAVALCPFGLRFVGGSRPSASLLRRLHGFAVVPDTRSARKQSSTASRTPKGSASLRRWISSGGLGLPRRCGDGYMGLCPIPRGAVI